MQDQDRGTYTPPTEDNLAYETRRSSGAPSQTPITLIVSSIFLVILLIAVILFYNSGYNNRSRLAKEVGQPLSDYRVTVQEAQPLTPDELTDAAPAMDGATASVNAPIIDAAPPAAAPITTAIPSQAATSSAAAPAPAQVSPPAQTAAVAPTVPPVTPRSTPAASGSAAVQIGAFATRQIAESQYNTITSNYAMFLGGTSRRIEEVEVNGKTLYRTSVSGFASKEKAREFCNALKSGGRDCFVR